MHYVQYVLTYMQHLNGMNCKLPTSWIFLLPFEILKLYYPMFGNSFY